MKLIGDWASDATYNTGDVLRYSNGEVYQLLKACKAGTPPTETLYWNKVGQDVAQAVKLILDGVDKAKTEAVATVRQLPEVESTDAGSALMVNSSGEWTPQAGVANKLEQVHADGIVVHSSTAGSNKDMKITVEDDGTITATEYTVTLEITETVSEGGGT